jgi:hypothetical protein
LLLALFPAVGPVERHVGLDLAAVAAAVLVLDDVPGFGVIGDARPGRDVAQPVRKLQFATPANYSNHF